MEMKPEEIRKRYAAAKQKTKQISILADLNDCDEESIKQIIFGQRKDEKYTIAPAQQISPAVYKAIELRMEVLSGEIRQREVEYKELTEFMMGGNNGNTTVIQRK